MDANGAVVARTRRPGGRAPWRIRAAILVVVIGALAIPFSVVPASAQSGGSGPAGEGRDDHRADRPARLEPGREGRVGRVDRRVQQARRRRGRTTPSSKPTCATRKGDANGEVDCARQMVDDGVVATLNDLTFNNPAGVVDVLESRRDPADRHRRPTDISEFQSSVSYPISAGVIAAYLGTAVGFKQDGNTKICLMRTDAPTGATFKGFLAPSFTAIGVDIIV